MGDRTKDKIRTRFMVDPMVLITRVEIENPTRIIFTDPEKICFMGILGESGQKFVKGDCVFIFEKEMADEYISWGIAIPAPENEMPETILINGISYIKGVKD